MAIKNSKKISKPKKEDLYRLLYTTSRDAIMTLEPPTWNFTAGNPAAVKMFGAKSEKEFVSIGPGKASPEKQPNGKSSQAEAKKMIDKALKEGSVFFEWVHKKINDEDFPATVLLTKVDSPDGLFVQATVRDITKEKKVEKEIVNIQKEYQIMFDSIPAWIFYKDKENRFIKVNKSFCKAMGKTKAELEGKYLSNFYSKKQAAAFLKDDLEVIKSGKPRRNIVERMESPQGELWVQTDKIPYKDENGNIVGVIGFTIDITKQKLSEEELIKSKSMLQRIIDLIPSKIFWKDKDLFYLGCNEAFAKIAGKESPEELIGKDDFDQVWGEEETKNYRADDKSVIDSEKEKLNIEEPQTNASGELTWIKTSKVPLTDKEGKVIGVLGIFNDITEQKKKDKELLQNMEELKKMNKLMIGRELKMVELKEKIKKLEKK